MASQALQPPASSWPSSLSSAGPGTLSQKSWSSRCPAATATSGAISSPAPATAVSHRTVSERRRRTTVTAWAGNRSSA
ncbi:hypothetical protein ACFQX6_50490 [Streptosporangium lutulentum]